jgi:predicted Rossmann fold nucleotide-binding protein DprA/Smf involved in DNA uptake
MTTTDIVQSIEERLQAIKVEITSLTDAKKALTNGDTPSKPKRRRAPARRARRQQKPTTEVMPVAAVEQILNRSKGGITTSAIAEEGNAKPSQVLSLLRELESRGKARRTGQRRGTRWHAITDEDRIAARAKELAARRRTAA